MTGSNPSDLQAAIALCVRACTNATSRAHDFHLRTEARTASQQLDSMNARIGRTSGAGKPIAALIAETNVVTKQLDAAVSDSAIDVAVAAAENLCAHLRQNFRPV
ncbi:MAG TPA: hypothetical protein VIM98_12580 [Dyella sp.]|uniref:hypothetical protein n=1 Tax=Dyella sp. TaxID=1869338 RepID=UPI002F926318